MFPCARADAGRCAGRGPATGRGQQRVARAAPLGPRVTGGEAQGGAAGVTNKGGWLRNGGWWISGGSS